MVFFLVKSTAGMITAAATTRIIKPNSAFPNGPPHLHSTLYLRDDLFARILPCGPCWNIWNRLNLELDRRWKTPLLHNVHALTVRQLNSGKLTGIIRLTRRVEWTKKHWLPPFKCQPIVHDERSAQIESPLSATIIKNRSVATLMNSCRRGEKSDWSVRFYFDWSRWQWNLKEKHFAPFVNKRSKHIQEFVKCISYWIFSANTTFRNEQFCAASKLRLFV